MISDNANQIQQYKTEKQKFAATCLSAMAITTDAKYNAETSTEQPGPRPMRDRTHVATGTTAARDARFCFGGRERVKCSDARTK